MNRSLHFPSLAAPAFTLFGALLVLVGVTQHELATRLHLGLADSGLLAAAMVLGVGIGVLAAGPLVDRLERRLLFVASAGATGIALLTVDSSMGFPRALAHLLFAGVGGGLYETLLNTETIERYAERSVRAMTLFHATTTVGAIATPLVLNGLASRGFAGDFPAVFRFIGAAHLLLAGLALGSPFGVPARSSGATRTDVPARETARVMTPSLAALCIAAFAYIGIESTMTAFSVPYAVDGLGLDAERGRAAISTLWLGLLAGRLVFAWRVGANGVRPAVSAGLAAGAVLALGVAFGWTAIELVTALVGFALGGVFPLLVALAGRRTPHATGSAVGLVAGLGSMGGFVVPWLTGIAGDQLGVTPALGALSLWCAVVAIAALYAERAHARSRDGAGRAAREPS